jgi:hypothetical protein
MADHKLLKLSSLLDRLWADYVKLNPQADQIYKAFLQNGEAVVNDHIALRTYAHPKVSIDKVARAFTQYGYVESGDYHFEEKCLYAKHFEHPNREFPKVFISELLYKDFSAGLRALTESIIDQIDAGSVGSEEFFLSGRTWDLSHKQYLDLAKESEYASWVAAIGFRPNHFTLSINHLRGYRTVQDVNKFIKSMGVALNSSGGEIKGTPQDFLEQSSTLANQIDVEFTDGRFRIPTCYYEFALRYALPSGQLYQGFVAKSADKIFESTNRR